jgi:hypothetical protein
VGMAGSSARRSEMPIRRLCHARNYSGRLFGRVAQPPWKDDVRASIVPCTSVNCAEAASPCPNRRKDTVRADAPRGHCYWSNLIRSVHVVVRGLSGVCQETVRKCQGTVKLLHSVDNA